MNDTTRKYPRGIREAFRDEDAYISVPVAKKYPPVKFRHLALLVVSVVLALVALAYKFAGPG